MDASTHENALARVAGAIAEPARTRMLCSLMDGQAKTSTELAIIAEVGPSTASAHLARLLEDGLIKRYTQGRHRYFSLQSQQVAQALEALMVLSQPALPAFASATPARLRLARTCYDHMAGTLAVALHDHCMEAGWLQIAGENDGDYRLTATGEAGLRRLGVDVERAGQQRRRFACPCLDWSMRRPHLAGALGAALLQAFLTQRWVTQDLDSRALALTPQGRGILEARLGLKLEPMEQPTSWRRPAADRTTRA